MDDRLFFPFVVLVALAMIALAMNWPQGLGARSTPPFGHPLAPQDTPAPSAPSSRP